jgi:tRNA threonylcarbamoyladenosine biosynthesis protein TsaE
MLMRDSEIVVVTLEQTFETAAKFASTLTRPACVYFQGDLGSGKTSFCQGLIAALGNATTVTSPTYNLLQEYPVDSGMVYHMDLYRLNDPSELEYLGLPDLWQDQSIFLVEWPERGIGYLPEATHIITLDIDKTSSEGRRTIRIQTAG